jgi:hypothetical protein
LRKYDDNILISEWASDTYINALDAANDIVRPILAELGVGKDEYPACHLKSDHLRCATIKVKWEDIRNQMQQKSVQSGWTKLRHPPDGSDEAFISSTYMVTFIPAHDKWYVLDYEQVMMITDTISSRFFTLLYMDLLLNDTPGKIGSTFIIGLYETFDRHLEQHGNIAYESISCWESVVLAAILQKYDPLEEAKKYYKWRLDSLQDEGKLPAVEILDTLMRSNLQVEQMCELHGLCRHWGHPTVNELKGCETVKNIAQNRPTPDKTTLEEMLGLFKRQFVVSFIGKHGRWPRCKIDDQSHSTPLSQAIINQLKAVNLHSPHYPLCDWAKIEFLQEFEFDYHADYTDLIDDKSLSVELSSLRTIYNPDSLGYQPG